MKKGINVWSFPAGMSQADCIRLAAATGYDSIELSLDATGDLSLESTDAEIIAFRTLADELGIEISSLATGLFWGTPLTHDDPAIREKARETVRFQLKAAKLLGVDAILVVPGCVNARFIEGCAEMPYDVVYDRALEAMQELKADAEAAGVVIALENVWNKFLLSPLEMRDFIDKVGSDYVKVYFDVGNTQFIGFPEHWIKILGSRIARIHMKDFKEAIGNLDGFCELLEGNVNFPAVMNALREVGYDGYLTAEINYIPCETDRVVVDTFKAMNTIFTY